MKEELTKQLKGYVEAAEKHNADATPFNEKGTNPVSINLEGFLHWLETDQVVQEGEA